MNGIKKSQFNTENRNNVGLESGSLVKKSRSNRLKNERSLVMAY